MAAIASDTDRLLALARAHLPGGGIWTFATRPPGFGKTLDLPDFLIERADGAYVWTTDGERLLDLVLGSGTVLTGHGHPEVVAAVTAQVARVVNASHLTPPAVELSARICAVVPCAERVRFFNSGTEAWAVALRVLRARAGRDRILKFEGAFHGGNDATLFNTSFGDVPTWAAAPIPTPDTPGTARSEAANVITAPYDDIDATRAIALAHRDELAAILCEPVMRGIAARPGFLEGLRELADEIHVPLVFDEVITGFRLGLGGAQAHYGVTPDLALFGKALGSGFPIGVIAGSEEVMEPLDPGAPDGIRVVAEGSTLANPLSATAALATLDILSRPGAYEHLHAWGNRLAEGLREAFARHGITIQPTGVGPIVEYYVSDSPVHDYRTALATDLVPKSRLAAGMRRHGVFGGGGRYNCSLAHGDAELAHMLDAVEAILAR
ncbi:MAG: aminotransferase class III-fold pyridoxal phosphate-dependent enzyme [Chloroflexi bacterium]|nr:aminotransferase class III-fold pyridoxal phosphate-dependent enzyme [Chloroflexota bacterium]